MQFRRLQFQRPTFRTSYDLAAGDVLSPLDSDTVETRGRHPRAMQLPCAVESRWFPSIEEGPYCARARVGNAPAEQPSTHISGARVADVWGYVF